MVHGNELQREGPRELPNTPLVKVLAGRQREKRLADCGFSLRQVCARRGPPRLRSEAAATGLDLRIKPPPEVGWGTGEGQVARRQAAEVARGWQTGKE